MYPIFDKSQKWDDLNSY